VAAKCNITGFALKELYKSKWGIDSESNVAAIAENYIEYLNCPNIKLSLCYPAKCKNDIIIFNCDFNVNGMTFYYEDGIPQFAITVGNYVGGVLPLTYQWLFDEENFEAVGPTDTESLTLTVIEGKDFDNLVTPITVTITDANGCEDTKVCYITPDGLRCNTNYQPCSNPSNLMIANLFKQCSGPSGLIVNKKN
jgi:hypothetical protein